MVEECAKVLPHNVGRVPELAGGVVFSMFRWRLLVHMHSRCIDSAANTASLANEIQFFLL